MAKDIYGLGAMGYHFGDAVSMEAMLQEAPENVLVMGNVSPAHQFRNGTPDSIREATRDLLDRCGGALCGRFRLRMADGRGWHCGLRPRPSSGGPV